MSLSEQASPLRARGQGAWRAFYNRYAPMIIGMAKRRGLSDGRAHVVLQETMTAVFRKYCDAQQFDDGSEEFRKWLMGIVRNKIADRRKSVARAPLELTIDLPRTDDLSEDEERTWRVYVLGEGLDQLATEPGFEPTTLQAFHLYAVQDMEAREVAKLLGMTRNAVFVAKCKVIRRLREIVAERREREGER